MWRFTELALGVESAIRENLLIFLLWQVSPSPTLPRRTPRASEQHKELWTGSFGVELTEETARRDYALTFYKKGVWHTMAMAHLNLLCCNEIANRI
jgi:hypothetical protein